MNIDQIFKTIGDFIRDFILGIRIHFEAVEFLKKHQVWRGFWKYKWVSSILMVVGILVGLVMFSILAGWISSLVRVQNAAQLGANIKSMAGEILEEGKGFFYLGSLKYVVLLLSEVLIFHVIRRTLEILTDEPQDGSFKTFWEAQVRMFQIVIRSWVLELILTIFISVIIGIIGFKFLKPILIFGIQAFFIGFTFIDNYNERYGVSIKESVIITKDYAGLATVVGMVTYALMMIPIIGVFIGPIIGAVAAALAMHQLNAKPKEVALT